MAVQWGLMIAEALDNLPKPPSTNGDNGRDTAGRFGPGNRHGRGNPLGGRVARLRAAMLRAVTPDDIRAVVKAMLDAAKGGDVAAAKLLLGYTVGEPRKAGEEGEARPVVAIQVNVAAGEPRARAQVEQIRMLAVPAVPAEAGQQDTQG